MQVTVKDNELNVRVGKPSLSAPCNTSLPPGSPIDVDGQLYAGDSYDGIDTWLRDTANNYYWSGGVNLNVQNYLDSGFGSQKLQYPIDYYDLLSLDPNIKSAKGQGVTIAILDHPISSSIQIQNNIIRPFHIGDPLFTFHANFIAGILAGMNGILGISNAIKIIELPIFNPRANSSGINITSVFDYINSYDGPMIINVSATLDDTYSNAISNFKADKIVIASAGIDNELTSGITRIPAALSNVIAVGAINSTSNLTNTIDSKVDIVFSNYIFTSYGQDMTDYIQDQGDSFACAVTSSIVALLISSRKASYDISSIKTALASIALPFSEPSSFSLFNVINPKT